MSDNVCIAVLSVYAAMVPSNNSPDSDEQCKTLLSSAVPRLTLDATAGIWLLEEAVEFVTASSSPDRADAALDMLGIIIAYIGITGQNAALSALEDFNQFQYDRGRPLNYDANNIMKILIGIANRPEAEADAIRMLERRAQSPQKAHMSHAIEGALRAAEAKRSAR